MAATPQLVIQVEGLPSLRDSGGGTDSGSTRRDLAGGCHVVQRGFPSHGGESTRAFLVVSPGACRNVKLTLNWGGHLVRVAISGGVMFDSRRHARHPPPENGSFGIPPEELCR